ncbi:hypothetical protein P280DRAFT_41137 [Massarina eburnea CBS 473.64]|uniref:Uncharacterized protein n=1 Tax=Massarina eburnea CBS 473.64 TaxID=1395130 RepID=A0A6A6RX38_9PLEO|nr:hypothetical protein P280DRAFT_41137 [Massarina eburnea CBS 473.64]
MTLVNRIHIPMRHSRACYRIKCSRIIIKEYNRLRMHVYRACVRVRGSTPCFLSRSKSFSYTNKKSIILNLQIREGYQTPAGKQAQSTVRSLKEKNTSSYHKQFQTSFHVFAPRRPISARHLPHFVSSNRNPAAGPAKCRGSSSCRDMSHVSPSIETIALT